MTWVVLRNAVMFLCNLYSSLLASFLPRLLPPLTSFLTMEGPVVHPEHQDKAFYDMKSAQVCLVPDNHNTTGLVAIVARAISIACADSAAPQDPPMQRDGTLAHIRVLPSPNLRQAGEFAYICGSGEQCMPLMNMRSRLLTNACL
jgi:hypothetical protein